MARRLAARGRRARDPEPDHGASAERPGARRHRARSSSRSGSAPVFGLTTELIVGSAPPERAGAATGMSETALRGRRRARAVDPRAASASAIYRARCAGPARRRPAGGRGRRAGHPRRRRRRSRPGCPADWAGAVLAAAQSAFVDGMQVAAIDQRGAVGRRRRRSPSWGCGTCRRRRTSRSAPSRRRRRERDGPRAAVVACARIGNMSVRFRTTILQTGKTAMGFEVPPAVVEALGAGKRPPVTGHDQRLHLPQHRRGDGRGVHDRRQLGASRAGGRAGRRRGRRRARSSTPRPARSTVPPELADAPSTPIRRRARRSTGSPTRTRAGTPSR